MKIFLLLLSSIFINNYVMSRFFGICPFLGVSKRISTAIGMGAAVIFVMTLASLITYFLQLLLIKLDIVYLQTIAFILVIAVLVQLVEMVINKLSPTLYKALGVYLPLITTNCAVLGVAILNVNENYNLIESLVNGFGSAVGFTLALVLFAGVREKLEYAPIPKAMQGFASTLLAAGLMSLAFLGFQGMI